MTPERYQQVGQVYRAALEIDSDQRPAYLAKACAGDEPLRQVVQSLLAHQAQDGGLIDQPILEAAIRAIEEDRAGVGARSLVGQSVGPYRIVSLLGKGGMGEVYLGEDLSLKRKVAIKLLPAEFTSDAGRVMRFAQEARAASALNHPNIITIHSIGEAPAQGGAMHYIVNEYVDGQTLRNRMNDTVQERMKPAEAVEIAAQIASALMAAHEAGILHRDIKPENVMVRRDGIVKVLDFGLAKLTELSGPESDSRASTLVRNTTDTGLVMGTPQYMSPEQARGEKVDTRTDIFSLGTVLYEMVAGRTPFAGATSNEVIAAILRDQPFPLAECAPDAPAELERILARALHKDRDERYQTVKDFHRDLKDLKENQAFQARLGDDLGSRTTSGTIIGKITSHKLGLAFTLAALLVAAVAAYFYFNRRPVLAAKDTILLADFQNKTGDDVFDDALRQGLATKLQESSFLTVFPAARVRQTLRLMERATDTRVTEELAREICERQNLKAFIGGSITPLGSHYVITLTAFHGRSGDELVRTQAEAPSKDQVLNALSRAAAQLRAQLGESLSSIQQSDKPLEQAMTKNLEALKAFSKSWELTVSGRVIEALPFARRAAELDPQFFLGWDQLAVICWATDQPEAAAEYQAKIVRLQEERAAQSKYPASEYYKLDITAWYERLVTGNLSKSLETFQVRRQMFPSVRGSICDVGMGHSLIGEFEQSIAPINECIRLNPNFGAPYRQVAQSLMRLNRYDESKDILKTALKLELGLTAYHTLLYQLAFIGADATGMQEQIAWAEGKPDAYVALDWQTGAAASAGQWRKAQEFSRQAINLAVRGENREVAARYATEQALRSAALGDFRLAKDWADEGMSLGRGRLPLARAALALALSHEPSRARAIADEISRRFPEDTMSNEVWLPVILAAIDLQPRTSEKRATLAIEHLKSASRYEALGEFWPQYLRGHAYLGINRGAEAAVEFQKIIDHRGQVPLSLLYPLAHLGLARSAEIIGDTAKNQKAHADFLAMWKDADDGLPIPH